jgi:predicted RNA-binding Zn ribbon-like protein
MQWSASEDEFLLAVLNSTPVVDGAARDELADRGRARAWLASKGGTGSAGELSALLEARSLLQATVRGERPAAALAPLLRGVTRIPDLTEDGVEWALRAPPDRELAVRAVLAWAALSERSPGRLRPCANDDCRLFLIDRSKANTARWCSMALCGNRMKARRHHRRARPGNVSAGPA